jgi:hypothetical protein
MVPPWCPTAATGGIVSVPGCARLAVRPRHTQPMATLRVTATRRQPPWLVSSLLRLVQCGSGQASERLGAEGFKDFWRD